MKTPSLMKRSTDRSFATVALAIFVAGMALTYWGWLSSVETAEKGLRDANSQIAESMERGLYERLVTYRGVLNGSVGLFDANSGNVSPEQWKQFVAAHRLSEQFPAIESFGYIEKVGSQAPVVYVEPETAPTPIGYDMSSNPVSLETMKRADKTRTVALSSVLTLKNTTGKSFMMFNPLYSEPGDTPEHRKQNIKGYVFLVINVDRMFTFIQERVSLKNINFAISEGADLTSTNYIYHTKGFNAPQNEIDSRVITLGRRDWTMHAVMDTSTITYKRAKYQPAFSLGFGLVVTVLFMIFIVQTLRSRSRKMNYIKQLELQKSRDGLLSLASHQLRTPATSVKQYVGMVLEGYAGPVHKKQRTLLARAYASNERQLELVNQILHISRIEAGRLELSNEPMNVVTVARKIISENKQTIKDKHQILKVKIDRKLPLVNGDPVYMGIVVENLISNASKYTQEKGNVSVRISSTKSHVIIEVSDTGVGIDSKDINQLFQKFSRVHNELSISSGGTGIGLYLSKLVVELHGGTIEAISRRGVGTTFRVKLPILNPITMKNLTDLKSRER